MHTILTWIKNHKKTSGLIALVIFGGGFYWYTSKSSVAADPTYVQSAVTKGTLVVSVTGSGQVSTSNQVDVKPQGSGTVLSVPVKNGQQVKKGQVLVQLDASSALRAVRDASLNLQSAQLAYEKSIQPPDTLTLIQTKNALAQAQEAKQTAEDDLAKSYDDGFTNVSNAFLELPTVITGLHDLLLGYSYTSNQANIDYYVDSVKSYDDSVTRYRDDAYNSYQSARDSYDAVFAYYKTTSRTSDTATIEKLISDSYATTLKMSEAIKNANNLIQFYEDRLAERSKKPSPIADTQLSTLNGYTTQTNTFLSTLLSSNRTIDADKQAIVSVDRTIAERSASLDKLVAGLDAIDLQSAQLTLRQRQTALADAQATLADYTMRSPIDGVVAKVDVKVGDQAGSASVVTLVAPQEVAEITMNEVDVAKIKVGQKATLTFDAVDGLIITGQVAEIDTLGTVTQGVVSYTVKISFDTQDDRIKSGMTTSAAIITDVKQDVLIVPQSAIKSLGTTKYVEMFDTPLAATTGANGSPSAVPPRQQVVEVGLSNDTDTEIVSGLKEGDMIVTRTVLPATTKAATTAPSLLNSIGGGRTTGGTGATRIPRN